MKSFLVNGFRHVDVHPGLRHSITGFYGPGGIPSDEDTFFLTDRAQNTLAIFEMENVFGFGPPKQVLLNNRLWGPLRTCFSGTVEKIVRPEWKHSTLGVQKTPHWEGSILLVGVCGPAILVLEVGPTFSVRIIDVRLQPRRASNEPRVWPTAKIHVMTV